MADRFRLGQPHLILEFPQGRCLFQDARFGRSQLVCSSRSSHRKGRSPSQRALADAAIAMMR